MFEKIIAEVYLEPCRVSKVEFLCENYEPLLAVNYFSKKTTSSMFDRVLIYFWVTLNIKENFQENISNGVFW